MEKTAAQLEFKLVRCETDIQESSFRLFIVLAFRLLALYCKCHYILPQKKKKCTKEIINEMQ